MNIVVSAGGKQWVVDENVLIAFLKTHGQEILTKTSSNGANNLEDRITHPYAAIPQDTYILKG